MQRGVFGDWARGDMTVFRRAPDEQDPTPEPELADGLEEVAAGRHICLEVGLPGVCKTPHTMKNPGRPNLFKQSLDLFGIGEITGLDIGAGTATGSDNSPPTFLPQDAEEPTAREAIGPGDKGYLLHGVITPDSRAMILTISTAL